MSTAMPVLGPADSKYPNRVSSGAMVTAWRGFLISRGYKSVGMVGGWDSNVDQATRQFQTSQGLTADGLVGPQTFAKAQELGFASAPTREDTVKVEVNKAQAGGKVTPNFLPSTPVAKPKPTVATSPTLTAEELLTLGGTPDDPEAAVVPFLDREAWAGGPVWSKALGIGALVGAGLAAALIAPKLLKPKVVAPPAPVGAANRFLGRRCCGGF